MNWYKIKIADQKSVPESIYIKLLLSGRDLKVWLVRGDLIRNNYSIDFTLGGHDKVYDFIPLNEVWIDDSSSEDERGYTIIHELRERRTMIEGEGYDEAHRQANILEILCRRDKIDVQDMITKELAASETDSKDCG